MAFDPNAPLRLQPVQFDSPMNKAGQAMSLRNMMLQQQGLESSLGREHKLQDILARYGNDRAGLQDALMGGGYLDEAGKIGDIRSSDVRMRNDEQEYITRVMKQFGTRVLTAGGGQQAYQEGLQWMKSQGAPEAFLAQMPPEYDEALVMGYAMADLPAEERMARIDEIRNRDPQQEAPGPATPEATSGMTPVPDGATDREWFLTRNADLTRMGLRNMPWDTEAIAQARQLEKGQSMPNRDFASAEPAPEAAEEPTDERAIFGRIRKMQADADTLFAEADTLEARADADKYGGGAGLRKRAEAKRERADGLLKQAKEMHDRATQYVEVNDPTSSTGVRYVPAGEAVNREAPGKKPLVDLSGANLGYQDLGKTAQNQVDIGLLDSSEQKAELMEMQKLFRPEFTEYGEKARMAALRVSEKAGKKISDADRAQMSAFHKWKSGALASLNAYIKKITGAALSEAEAQRIRAAFPDPGEGIFDGDSASEYQAKLDTAIKRSKMAEARYHYIKKNGLSITSKSNGDLNFANIELDEMPGLINKRGVQLEAEFSKGGLKGDELESAVRNQLAEEFGLL